MYYVSLKVTIPIIVILTGLLFAFHFPIGSKLALADNGLHITCPAYNYIFPAPRNYHILLGQYGTYQSLEPIPHNYTGCTEPIHARLYL